MRTSVLVLSLASAAAAQAPFPCATAMGLVATDGGFRGGGPGYALAADVRGATITPALGRTAARTYPLRLRAETIGRGAQRVALDADVVPARLGETLVFARGAGVQERYELRERGVELSVVLASPLAGTGDVVVSLAAETALSAPPRETAGELTLDAGPRRAAVRIGAVTGLDAEGRRAGGTLRWRDGALELVVPAAFVDAARYPLVVDPVIGLNYTIAGAGSDDSAPDVAYHAASNTYLVVWQTELSATASEIRAQRQLFDGTPVGALLQLVSAATLAQNPTVASVRSSGQFAVAWQESNSPFGPFDVRAVCIDAATGAVSPSALVASGGDALDPDLGGEANASGNAALVVWSERGVGVHGATLTCAGPGQAPVPSLPVALSSGDDRLPAISKSGGAPGVYVVTWERAGGAASEVHGRAVDRAMNPLTAETAVATAGVDATQPDVDGDGADFAVAFERLEGAGSARHDVFCRLLHYDAGAGSLGAGGGEVLLSSGSGVDEIEPAVGWLGPKVMVAWARERGFLQYDCFLHEFDPKTCAACGLGFASGGTRLFDGQPEIAANRSADPTLGGAALAVFSSADRTPPFASDVLGHRFAAFGSGGAVADLGGGCGNSGTAGRNGAFALGNAAFRFQLTGADPGASTAIFVLNADVAPIACGACAVLPPLVSLTLPLTGGAAGVPVPVPCDVNLLGGAIAVQWWVPGTAVSPCPLGPTVSISNRLRATVGL